MAIFVPDLFGTFTDFYGAEDIASQLSTCGLDEESSSTDTVFYSKRRRDGTGGSISMSGQSRKAHKSTGEVLASLGLTYKHFDLCNVRCGKDAVLPLRQAVENAFSSTVVRLCGVMPLSLLRRCFEQAIDTIDRMLIGFTKGVLDPLSELFPDRLPTQRFLSCIDHT